MSRRKLPSVAVWASVVFWTLLALCLPSTPLFAACDEIPVGRMMRVRLLDPVSSYSGKRGTPIRAMVVESPQCDGLPFFERGTEVSGRIKSVHRVGLGFRHESAAVELVFDWISEDIGPSRRMSTQVVSIDDAREKVKNGVIRGITPADTPQNRLFIPIPLSFDAWNPYSYWLNPLFKAAFPIAPEPEIYFPPGTDMRIEFTEPLAFSVGTVPVNPQFSSAEQRSLDELVTGSPQRSYNTKGREADVVNLMFLGTPEQIARAFRIAGWLDSDPLSARSVLRGFHAVFADTSDPSLPMAHHLLDGQPSEFALEKSLDSYAKRDHLRIWLQPETWKGQTVWLSASTAELGAGWSFRHRRFEHNVNPQVDDERQKIVRDLSLAGCVSAVYNAARPSVPHKMETTSGTDLFTDGAIAIVELSDCELPWPDPLSGLKPGAIRPKSKLARFIRTEVLTVRNVWRDNPVYAGYEVARMTAHAVGHEHARQPEGVVAASAGGAIPPPAAALPARSAAPDPGAHAGSGAGAESPLLDPVRLKPTITTPTQ